MTLTPELNAWCAAIWSATNSRHTWTEVLGFCETNPQWEEDRDRIVRQATAAMALAAEREKGLREALERCAAGAEDAQSEIAEHFLGVLQKADIRPSDAIGCFAIAVGYAMGLSGNEWSDEGAAVISDIIASSCNIALAAARGAME